MNVSLISYDISCDHRRTLVYKLLKNHGFSVQKSVFECRLPDRKLQELQVKLSGMLNPTTDSIRIYRLCKKCLCSVEVMALAASLMTTTICPPSFDPPVAKPKRREARLQAGSPSRSPL